MSDARPWRQFTWQEKQEMRERRAAGGSYAAIGRAMGRTTQCIWRWFNRTEPRRKIDIDITKHRLDVAARRLENAQAARYRKPPVMSFPADVSFQ
jgi:hypothetical protein